ncbi:MAG: di-trans,poly-cis-decaprenylcistransferase [Dehalococcoidia bacterium]|nr:di-trans,poly-cis-decaprenylcistransferase [Dehalococcoidia bacterium]
MLKRLIYRYYERGLATEVARGRLPHHVGVVLDGNRRFALKRGLARAADGHRFGAENADHLVTWCDELRIPVVTLWALSTDNLRRPPEELEAIYAIVEDKVEQLAEMQARSSFPRRVRAVGRRELLPSSTQAAIQRVEDATAGNAPNELIVAVGYGGREEITDAVRRMIADRLVRGDSLEGIASGLHPDEISRYLYAPDVPDPDLIIRTSGELRLSGFLLWQSAYSEYYFCDAFWPEFRRIDFLRALRSYAQRERRRGG